MWHLVLSLCILVRVEEFPANEVVCLWLAKGLMWLDNFSIALRYWSTQEPYLVCVWVCVWVCGWVGERVWVGKSVGGWVGGCALVCVCGGGVGE